MPTFKSTRKGKKCFFFFCYSCDFCHICDGGFQLASAILVIFAVFATFAYISRFFLASVLNFVTFVILAIFAMFETGVFSQQAKSLLLLRFQFASKRLLTRPILDISPENSYSEKEKPLQFVKRCRLLRAVCCKDRIRSARQKKTMFSQFARMKAEINQLQKKKSQIVQVVISFFL